VIASQDGKERTPKATKLSEPTSTSISSRLSSGAYADLTALCEDADHVRRSIAAEVRSKTTGGGEGRLSLDDLKQIQRVQAFAQVVADVVAQESKYEAFHGNRKVKEEEGFTTNGHRNDRTSKGGGQGGTVLTLFGNAPTPKQLFTSTQQASSGRSNGMLKTELPVEEMSLPNGLIATKIMPVLPDDRKKGPTFEEAFAPPSNLPTLKPPPAQKRSTTRDTIITWEFKDLASRAHRKGGYTTQSQTVADWLGYGGVDGRDGPSSPTEKRKQRDRALSGGESSGAAPFKDSLAEAEAKEAEALFRRAYSSFAPSCDNSSALVSEETKTMVWWNKVGEQRYEEMFAIDPALLDEHSSEAFGNGLAVEGAKNEDEGFGRAVEEFEDLEKDMPAKPVRDKTDVEQVLQEISDLLKTLASHQRIRTASVPNLATVSRTPISPAPALSSRIGRPDSPTEDEVSTYMSLRRELAYIILQLPPYAVAKLKGDQLADLGVNKLISFESKDMKGTMEEDHVARLAKYTAMATAAGIASLTRPGSTNTQHYSATAQRTPAIGQAANTRYGQSAQYGASRTPMQPTFQRSTSNQSLYGTPSATAPRPGFGQQPNQYSRPPSATYAQPGSQQYYQRSQQTPGGFGGYQQQYGSSTPQTQQRTAFASSSQPLAQFQQRAVNAAAYQSGQHRTASPIKPAGLQPIIQPQRPPQYPPSQQPDSGRGTPVNYSQPPTPANVNGYPRPPQAVAPRESSGTPQPIAPHPPPPQLPPTNGHR